MFSKWILIKVIYNIINNKILMQQYYHKKGQYINTYIITIHFIYILLL